MDPSWSNHQPSHPSWSNHHSKVSSSSPFPSQATWTASQAGSLISSVSVMSDQGSSQSSQQNYSPWNTNVSLLSSGIGHSTWSSLQKSKPWPSWDSQNGPGLDLLVSALTSIVTKCVCCLATACCTPLRYYLCVLPQGSSLQHHHYPAYAFAFVLGMSPTTLQWHI